MSDRLQGREAAVAGVVTVGIPVYKRLSYLPRALESVAAQDYPRIDLLVSDNGPNGPELRRLIERHYPHPYRFRQNPQSVEICRHYNQLVASANGEYFMLLCDDDEIAPGAISRLVQALKDAPEVAVALPRLEVIDEAGTTRPRRPQPLPPRRMTGLELVRIWCEPEYNFVCFVTNLARTADVRAVGAYPELPKGTATDDALLLKLCLGREVAFVPEAVFRYRVYEASHGLALDHRELATDLRAFLSLLDSDPVLTEFAARHPEDWKRARRWLVSLTWRTYRSRWRALYRRRLSRLEWVRAAFAMPFIPAYYRWVLSVLVRKGLAASGRLLRGAER